MSKKKKRSQALSDSSVEEKNHGSTTPHGSAARGKTHKGGNSKGWCPLGSISPPATNDRHRATDHRASSYRQIAQWTRRRHRPASNHHRAQVTGHGSPATVQMGITHEISSQSMTDHRPSSLRSLDLENLNTGKFIFTNHWPPVTGQSTNGHRSTDLISTYS